MKQFLSLRNLTYAAVIAALYCVITLFVPILSGFQGNFQLRVAEAFTLLPVIMPAAVPGVFVGCLLSNILGGATIFDIVFGSVATLMAGLLTYKLRNHALWIAALPPVIVNMFVVGPVLSITFGLPMIASILWVGLGQVCACYLLGIPLILSLKKAPFLSE